MTLRDLLAALGSTAVFRPLSARAQQPRRTYRIGVLGGAPRNAPHVIALYDALSRLEGQNLQIDWEGYGLKAAQLAPHAAELVKAKVDVIVSGEGAAVRAAQQATSTIPILIVTDDMVGAGLAQSIARPGGNTTGVSILGTELDGKRQELLIELLPGVHRLADPLTTAFNALQALQRAAQTRGVDLVIHGVAAPEEIAPAIVAAKASGVSG